MSISWGVVSTTSDRPVKIITFSGIDGAGKSTQIEALKSQLEQIGLRVKLLTFWDDVVVLPKFREAVSYTAFKGDRGIGTPEKPLNRRDKNVSSWPLTAARFFLYFADAVNLTIKLNRIRVDRIRTDDVDVVIFDRYIYDELANVPLNWWLPRAFVRLLLRLIPKPDLAFLIDADPVLARERKPEYPLEFLLRNRESYLALSRLIGGMTLIEALSVEATRAEIARAIAKQVQPVAQGFSTASPLDRRVSSI
jgi:thymidylate kinase